MFLKKYTTWILFGVIVAATTIGYVLYHGDTSMKTMLVTIHGARFSLHVAQTDKEMQTGLAAFDHITDDEGMFFRGLPAGDQSIWMKDMRYDIDILWVGRDNRVIHIENEVSKNSYPTVYRNPAGTTSSYVIELSSGAAARNGITIGDTVTLH